MTVAPREEAAWPCIRRAVLATLTALALAACSACDEQSPFGEDWAKPDVALKIEVPASAAEVQKTIEPSTQIAYTVEFLMPNDLWRDYVTKYYPGRTLSQHPYDSEIFIPPPCIPAARAGATMTRWITGDNIPYFDTGKTAHRSVSVTPDCKPGLAQVEWMLKKPAPSK